MWMKDGVQLKSVGAIEIRPTAGGGSTVTVANPTNQHEGFYQCFATNILGTALSVKTFLRKAG